MAMEARCYRGGAGRTRMHKLAYTRLDLHALLAIIALYAVIILCNVLHLI